MLEDRLICRENFFSMRAIRQPPFVISSTWYCTYATLINRLYFLICQSIRCLIVSCESSKARRLKHHRVASLWWSITCLMVSVTRHLFASLALLIQSSLKLLNNILFPLGQHLLKNDLALSVGIECGDLSPWELRRRYIRRLIEVVHTFLILKFS